MVLVLTITGCGGGEDPPTAATATPTASPAATASPSPTPTAEPTPSPTAEPTPGPEAQEGGAGDEEAPRVPVDVTVDGEGVTPPVIEVPAFFALEITVRNDLDREVTLRLGDVALTAPPGGRGRGRHPGLRPGEHRLGGDGVPGATIVAGDGAVGP